MLRRKRTLILLALTLLTSLHMPVTPAIAAAEPPPAQGAPQATLLSRYHRLEPNGEGGKDKRVDDILYQPRAFRTGVDADSRTNGTTTVTDPTTYEGWDILAPPRWSNNRTNNWLHFKLTRRAMVAIVWTEDDFTPSWLTGGWNRSGAVEIDGRWMPVYKKKLGRGAHSIPGPARNSSYVSSYLVLMAEETGMPSAPPLAPEGKQAPTPNDVCPQWVHDAYTTVGPDGDTYGTWHPQIDPVYWCYFEHHHGSDPSIIPGSPKVAYQYVADKVPQVEPDVGFKEMIFKDPRGYYVRMIEHVATGHHRRVCAQFHTVYTFVYDAQGKELFGAGFKADFGATVDQDGRVPTDPDCGYNMAAVAATTTARKELRIGPNDHDYERWVTEPTLETANLGIILDHSFDIRDPFTFCSNLTCNSVGTDPDDKETGTRRTFNIDDVVFDSSLALSTGVYHTDPFGEGLVAANAPNATRQYAKAGFRLDFDHDRYRHCTVVDPWTQRFACNGHGDVPRTALEHSLRADYADGDLPDITFARPTCNGRLATIVGTGGDDIITGSPIDDVIVGLGGNDVIDGGGGDDLICGGLGADTLRGGGGDDVLLGGHGRDKLYGQAGSDWLFGGYGNDKLYGGAKGDFLAGQGADDIVWGAGGGDLILGGPGSDSLDGGKGNDVVDGQFGNDSCDGGPGSNSTRSCEGPA